MYTVIGYGGTRAFRVLWMLEELGILYAHERVMPFTDHAQTRTPGGRLPALELSDGQILLDSIAIITFLADRHEALTFPPGTVERARQDELLQLVMDSIDHPLMYWTLAVQRRGEPVSDDVKQWCGRRVVMGMHRIGEMLADNDDEPWLTGRAFTIADIVLGHCLHWADRYGLSPSHPRLLRHFSAVELRPAYRNADCA